MSEDSTEKKSYSILSNLKILQDAALASNEAASEESDDETLSRLPTEAHFGSFFDSASSDKSASENEFDAGELEDFDPSFDEDEGEGEDEDDGEGGSDANYPPAIPDALPTGKAPLLPPLTHVAGNINSHPYTESEIDDTNAPAVEDPDEHEEDLIAPEVDSAPNPARYIFIKGVSVSGVSIDDLRWQSLRDGDGQTVADIIADDSDPDMDAEAIIKMDAATARKISNLLQTLGPIFKKTVGAGVNAEGVVSDLMVRVESVKARLLPIFHTDDAAEIPDWLRGRLTRYAVDMVADEPSASVDDIVKISETLAQFSDGYIDEDVVLNIDPASLQLTLMKCIADIEFEINEFQSNLLQINENIIVNQIEDEREEILAAIAEFLIEKTTKNMPPIAAGLASRRARSIVAETLMGQISSIFVGCFRYEISKYWESTGTSHQQRLRQSHIRGVADKLKSILPGKSAMEKAGSRFDAIVRASHGDLNISLDNMINIVRHQARGD